jgi:hypothetical protein
VAASPAFTSRVTQKGDQEETEMDFGFIYELASVKDWMIAIVGGLVASIIFLFCVTARVPKLKISKYIVKNPQGIYRIKVINTRKKILFIHGDAIDCRAEMHFVKAVPSDDTTDIHADDEERDEVESLIAIELVRKDPLLIKHGSEFTFRAKRTAGDIASKLTTGDYRAIRFRIYAKDSLSNCGDFTTQYCNKGDAIVEGDYAGFADIRVNVTKRIA